MKNDSLTIEKMMKSDEYTRIISVIYDNQAPMKFSEIKRKFPGINDGQISRPLRKLNEYGVVKKIGGKWKLSENVINTNLVSGIIAKFSDKRMIDGFRENNIITAPNLAVYGMSPSVFDPRDDKSPLNSKLTPEYLKFHHNGLVLNKLLSINENDITILVPDSIWKDVLFGGFRKRKKFNSDIYTTLIKVLPPQAKQMIKENKMKLKIQAASLRTGIPSLAKEIQQQTLSMKKEYRLKMLGAAFAKRISKYGTHKTKVFLQRYREVLLCMLNSTDLITKNMIEEWLTKHRFGGYKIVNLKGNRKRTVPISYGMELLGKHSNFIDSVSKLTKKDVERISQFLENVVWDCIEFYPTHITLVINTWNGRFLDDYSTDIMKFRRPTVQKITSTSYKKRSYNVDKTKFLARNRRAKDLKDTQ